MNVEKNNLNKNGKVINPISATINVIKLDWSKLNTELNEYLHTRFPEQKDDSWYFEDMYCGLIEKNDTYIILTKDAVFMTLEIFDPKKKIIGFEIAVYKDSSEENTEPIIPQWDFKLAIDEIEKTKTDVIVPLHEFMESRYKYNRRITSNEDGLIQYLQEETNYFKK